MRLTSPIMLALSACIYAQFPPPPIDPGEPKLSMSVDLVMLDVAVKDSDGQFAEGLTSANFKIFENGDPQEVRYFQAEGAPVTSGVVVDSSASMARKRSEAILAALSFLKTSDPKDEMFVVNFNERVRFGLPDGKPFSGDIPTLRTALMLNAARGRTALYDAVADALRHTKRGKHGRKALLVISDGGDNASAVEWDELVEMALEINATIYTIGIFDGDDRDKNPRVLKKLAKITGGEYFRPDEIKELTPICQEIAQDIRNRYVIAYAPRHVKPVGRERKIEVKATSPTGEKLKTRTRTEYLAPEPLESQ